MDMQEYEQAILEKYDIKVAGTRKTRGAILCDTDQGVLLLREVTGAVKRMPVLCGLYDFLRLEGFEKTDYILRTKEKECVAVMDDGRTYVLKRWFEGRECDVKRPGEILACSGELAKLHIIMCGEALRESLCAPAVQPPADEEELPLLQEYRRHNRELLKLRKFIRNLTVKGRFEYAFLGCFDQMYQWCQAAAEELAASGCQKLARESRRRGCLIHGEYNYHNILILPGEAKGRNAGNRLAVTGFEKFRQDIQVEDLYYFLRKVMEKHGWKVRLGDNAINAYSAIRPISQAEMDYLRLRFIYPEKLWKTADSYYRSNKAWVSSKNVEKLETAIRQTEEKKRFLEEIFSFHL